MNLTAWMQSHRTSVLWLLGLMVAGGLAAALKLPVALFPHADFPRIVINLDAGDRPADRMAIEVTVPIEEAVRSVPGLKSIRSETSRGSCDVSVNFDPVRRLTVVEKKTTPAFRNRSDVVSTPSRREASTKSASSSTSGWSITGISAGSFCPSASSVMQ